MEERLELEARKEKEGVHTGRNPTPPVSSEPSSKVRSKDSWERLRDLANAGHSAQDTLFFPLPLVDVCSSFRSQLNHHLLQEALSISPPKPNPLVVGFLVPLVSSTSFQQASYIV